MADATCTDQGDASCGHNGRCDGVGGCQRYATGTLCAGDVCDLATNLWTPAGACEAGGCRKPAPRSCSPFRCDARGERCATTCTSNADCDGGSVCRDGSCGLRLGGSLCGKGSDCTSGFCAQGVCCNTACDGSCYACNLPDRLGICAALPDDARDPAGVCKDESERSCGNDGTCNGSGGCRNYGSDTVCAAATCRSGMKTSASFCSGTGKCLAGSAVACDPYVCNASGTDCFSSCHGTGAAPECLRPNLCNDQRCGDAHKGQACAATADCVAGLTCVDHICCESSCAGPCKTCKRTPGTCTDLPAGSTTSGCKPDDEDVCGRTGKCNGSGACALASTKTVCAAGTCAGAATGTKPATCDGHGACDGGAPLDCSDNKCMAGACLPCTQDADCLNGRVCELASGTCRTKAGGVACTSGAACASGSCVDGHCCTQPACGPCQSCSSGTCAPVKNAPDPDTCPDEGAANPCGHRGCDGAGVCAALPGSSTVVTPLACRDPSTTTVTTCDGSGHAVTTEKACLPGETCKDGLCKLSLGGACGKDEQCSSGHCADGVCCQDACDGSCQACSAMGSCTAVKSAPDPDTCPDESASKPCGRTGCDDTGACQHAAAGSACGAPACESDVLALPRCNGDGVCAVEHTDCAAVGMLCATAACVSPPPDAAPDSE
jgi:hypothetical protein